MAEHVKIHVNNSQFLDLVTMPHSFRVGFAPVFFPRMQVGDVRGTDYTRWSSFVQSRFDGGSGQIYWSSQTGNNRYAESHLVTIGSAGGRLRPADLVNMDFGTDLDHSVYGDFAPAIMPVGTTQHAKAQYTLFTTEFPMVVLPFSNRPTMWSAQGHYIYTNVTDTQAWITGVTGAKSNKLTGEWAVIGTHAGDVRVYGAVKFSSVALAALGPDGINGFGAPVQGTAAAVFAVSYNTAAYNLWQYDSRLWRSDAGRVAYLRPAINTLDASWSDFIDIGDPLTPIHKEAVYNGRMYFGKADALWVFEGGKVYEIESFADQADIYNFRLLTVHKGSLYFNIRDRLLRVTGEGIIEEIEVPFRGGTLLDGTTYDGELYMIFKRAGGSIPGNISVGDIGQRLYTTMISGETELYIYNSETGGTRLWHRHNVIGAQSMKYYPNSLRSMFGLLFMAPMIMTTAMHGTDMGEVFPVSAYDSAIPEFMQIAPEVAQAKSYLITSMFDFGLPQVDKLFDALYVDYSLGHEDDRIEVSYIPKLVRTENPSHIAKASNSFFDIIEITTNTVDNDLSTSSQVNWTSLFSAGNNHNVVLTAFKRRPTHVEFIVDFPDAANKAKFLDSVAEGLLQWYVFDGTQFTAYGLDPYTSISVSDNTPPGYTTIEFAIPDSAIEPWPTLTATEVDDVFTNKANFVDSGDELYWVGFINLANDSPWQNITNIREVRWASDTDVELRNQNWVKLGDITGETDAENTNKRLEFPDNTVSRQIMLRFDFWATRASIPQVRRFDLNYATAQSRLKVYNFAALAAQDIQYPNELHQVTHSAEYITETLFSLAGSPLTYICDVPYPYEHTVRARISIASPGGQVAQLTDIGPQESIIPITLDEM